MTEFIDSPLSRRRFLQQNTAAFLAASVAGMTVAELFGAARPGAKNPHPIRLGIAGGGPFGNTFQHFQDHPDCEVVGVTDVRPRRRARLMQTYRCSKAYDSLEEMVKDRSMDAIAIFTDGNLHVDHVVRAMKHGKHVISACPAAWGSYEDADRLYDAVKSSGLTYMMAETSVFSDFYLSAKQMYDEGKFGDIYHFESAYQHPGMEVLCHETGNDGPPWEKGKRTWRRGFPPMFYPTHNIGYFTGMTGERLVEVSCTGWGDDDPILKDNAYKNPFWNCYGQFLSDKGHSARIDIVWKGPVMPGHPTRWTGTKMSFYANNNPQSALHPATLIHEGQLEKASDGYKHQTGHKELFQQEEWYRSERLPEPLRVRNKHCDSHTFICHEFIQALKERRRPLVHVAEALAYTVPGIVAHQSALRGGEKLKIRHYDVV